MNEEQIRRAASRMEEAAEQATRAADRMEESARRIAHLLEDGYGGNGLRLLEALDEAKNIPILPPVELFVKCPRCNGESYIQFMRWGIVPAAEQCPVCYGRGKVLKP